jgi:hypothetical protein
MAGKPFWLLINRFKANTDITCSMVIKLVTLNQFDGVHVSLDITGIDSPCILATEVDKTAPKSKQLTVGTKEHCWL